MPLELSRQSTTGTGKEPTDATTVTTTAASTDLEHTVEGDTEFDIGACHNTGKTHFSGMGQDLQGLQLMVLVCAVHAGGVLNRGAREGVLTWCSWLTTLLTV